MARKKMAEVSADQHAATELVSPDPRVRLVVEGPDALLKQLTKSVIETALSEEMTDHLGYEKSDPAGIGSVNNSDSLDHP